MSTFLELCQDLAEEAGISDGTTPTAVTGQTGELKRVVGWIARAYREVQRKRPRWNFLRNDFSFPTVVGTSNYASSVASTEHQRWKLDTFRCYLTATGVVDEQDLVYIPWDEYRVTYLYGANRNVSGRPMRFTVKPDESIELWPKPDAIYTITGEHWWKAQVMSADDDEPLFPDDFHEILMWRGLMYYAAYEEAAAPFAEGQSEFGRIFAKLEADQLPPIETAPPLA